MTDKKQTAMALAIEYLRSFNLLSAAIILEDKFIELEREQICEAFVAGDERGTKEIPFNCEQYFTQTYNPHP